MGTQWKMKLICTVKFSARIKFKSVLLLTFHFICSCKCCNLYDILLWKNILVAYFFFISLVRDTSGLPIGVCRVKKEYVDILTFYCLGTRFCLFRYSDVTGTLLIATTCTPGVSKYIRYISRHMQTYFFYFERSMTFSQIRTPKTVTLQPEENTKYLITEKTINGCLLTETKRKTIPAAF